MGNPSDKNALSELIRSLLEEPFAVAEGFGEKSLNEIATFFESAASLDPSGEKCRETFCLIALQLDLLGNSDFPEMPIKNLISSSQENYPFKSQPAVEIMEIIQTLSTAKIPVDYLKKIQCQLMISAIELEISKVLSSFLLPFWSDREVEINKILVHSSQLTSEWGLKLAEIHNQPHSIPVSAIIRSLQFFKSSHNLEETVFAPIEIATVLLLFSKESPLLHERKASFSSNLTVEETKVFISSLVFLQKCKAIASGTHRFFKQVEITQLESEIEVCLETIRTFYGLRDVVPKEAA